MTEGLELHAWDYDAVVQHIHAQFRLQQHLGSRLGGVDSNTVRDWLHTMFSGCIKPLELPEPHEEDAKPSPPQLTKPQSKAAQACALRAFPANGIVDAAVITGVSSTEILAQAAPKESDAERTPKRVRRMDDDHKVDGGMIHALNSPALPAAKHLSDSKDSQRGERSVTTVAIDAHPVAGGDQSQLPTVIQPLLPHSARRETECPNSDRSTQLEPAHTVMGTAVSGTTGADVPIPNPPLRPPEGSPPVPAPPPPSPADPTSGATESTEVTAAANTVEVVEASESAPLRINTDPEGENASSGEPHLVVDPAAEQQPLPVTHLSATEIKPTPTGLVQETTVPSHSTVAGPIAAVSPKPKITAAKAGRSIRMQQCNDALVRDILQPLCILDLESTIADVGKSKAEIIKQFRSRDGLMERPFEEAEVASKLRQAAERLAVYAPVLHLLIPPDLPIEKREAALRNLQHPIKDRAVADPMLQVSAAEAVWLTETGELQTARRACALIDIVQRLVAAVTASKERAAKAAAAMTPSATESRESTDGMCYMIQQPILWTTCGAVVVVIDGYI